MSVLSVGEWNMYFLHTLIGRNGNSYLLKKIKLVIIILSKVTVWAIQRTPHPDQRPSERIGIFFYYYIFITYGTEYVSVSVFVNTV